MPILNAARRERALKTFMEFYSRRRAAMPFRKPAVRLAFEQADQFLDDRAATLVQSMNAEFQASTVSQKAALVALVALERAGFDTSRLVK